MTASWARLSLEDHVTPPPWTPRLGHATSALITSTMPLLTPSARFSWSQIHLRDVTNLYQHGSRCQSLEVHSNSVYFTRNPCCVVPPAVSWSTPEELLARLRCGFFYTTSNSDAGFLCRLISVRGVKMAR